MLAPIFKTDTFSCMFVYIRIPFIYATMCRLSLINYIFSRDIFILFFYILNCAICLFNTLRFGWDTVDSNSMSHQRLAQHFHISVQQIERKAKTRNRCNQVPYLTRNTIWEVTKTQENTIRKNGKRSALYQQVTTRLQGTYRINMK